VAEQRIVLRNCGIIDPVNINTYLERDGFRAWEKVRDSMSQQQVIDEIKASGLRGRGGAGFPTGLKWELAHKAPGDQKYIICNADEGEIGTFKDKYILEHDPFTLFEAMIIAGYSIGARKGYIYLRAEYIYLLDMLRTALAQVKDRGYLEEFDIEVKLGAGAYVCGEESALMESIEGKRGEVRFKPPFPPSSGLWEKPTIINNVETLMNIPPIIANGGEWFAGFGTEKSKGTKVFSVSGDVEKPGVYEMVLGSTLRELVEVLAHAGNVQMIQVGGAAGRVLPYTMINSVLAFEDVLGAGAIIVYDTSRDILEVLYRTMEFLAEESCGKCTPCREGTTVMCEMLERLYKGEGIESDIGLLEELSSTMQVASMCGLGQAAPIPVIDSLKYFRDSYTNRISKNDRSEQL
jgi:NADH:ubiquinone oxidoreductase subunit F (NADH-binding)